MNDVKIAGAVVIGNSSAAYQLIGKLGTANQGKVAIQGIEKPIPFKAVDSVIKSPFAAAVLGTTTFPIPASPASGDELIIKVVADRASRPDTKETTFVNAGIGPNESLDDDQWGARIVEVFNGNPAAAEVFTASYSGGVVTLTQKVATVGEAFVKSNVSTIVTTVVSAGRQNKGMTAAQVTALVNSTEKEHPVIVLGSYAASNNFDVYTINVGNFTAMKPFGFKENKPEAYLVIVDTAYIAWEADFDAIWTMTPGSFDVNVYHGFGRYTDVSFADAGDIFTKNNHGFADGQSVLFSGITTTTGFTPGTIYYVKRIDDNTFTLALTPGGATVVGTSPGTNGIICPAPIPSANIVGQPVVVGDWAGDASAEELLCPTWMVL